MNLGESLKQYVSYFQSLMALVYNYNNNVATAAFINELQVPYSFYKHLMKHKVTKMRDILTCTQKCIQIENATRSSANHSPKREGKMEKHKAQSVPLKKTSRKAVGAVKKPARNLAKSYGDEANFIPFKVSID